VCGATVTYPDATKSGNCSINPVTSNHPSGSLFPVGTTNVIITDTKLDGSAATCDFDVTVNDTEFPVVSQPTTNPNTLWPPNHQMVDVAVNYTATDNCPLTCVLTVSSNEPIDGLGDGDTAPDWQVINDHNVKLRSERAGKASDRIYTITTTCTDASGNTTVKTSTVVVPKSMKGSLPTAPAAAPKGGLKRGTAVGLMVKPESLRTVKFDFENTATVRDTRSGGLINLLTGGR
jgi:hypothetical protein